MARCLRGWLVVAGVVRCCKDDFGVVLQHEESNEENLERSLLTHNKQWQQRRGTSQPRACAPARQRRGGAEEEQPGSTDLVTHRFGGGTRGLTEVFRATITTIIEEGESPCDISSSVKPGSEL